MSEIKVNKVSPRTNCGTVTVGDSGDSVSVSAGVPVTVNGDLKSNALKAIDGGSIISQCGTNITLGASGDTINLAAGASQTGFGRTGTVDWDTTPKTASFDAVSGDGFFCNTTSGAFTATLPSGAAGAIVSFADYAATWQTNNLTVSPQSGEKIGGVSADVVLNTQGQSVTFVYIDSTQGWVNVQDSTSNVRAESFITATGGTITTCGNDKIHTFTGPGTFCVTGIASCSANNQVSYLVVAGGGAGGARGNSGEEGGGGGAGGFREDKSPVTPYTASPLDGAGNISVTATAFPITVGGGGTRSPNGSNPGVGGSGSNSIFSTITSAGGGGGGGQGGSGNPGGSGGGTNGGPRAGATSGNVPPVSPPQGNGGANGLSSPNRGGGGGGAGAAATDSPGGNGVSSSITGSSVARAGGGAGRRGSTTTPGGSGGGASGPSSNGSGNAGTANTGGGGSGALFSGCAGGGGSGIVIIRYKFQ